MLSTRDLALCQATCGLTRTTPAQILRKTLVADGWGGQIETWAAISPAGLRCRVSPQSKRWEDERVQEERLTLANRWRIALPPGTSVLPQDRISALGNTYEVATIGAARTVEIERIVYCWLVQ